MKEKSLSHGQQAASKPTHIASRGSQGSDEHAHLRTLVRVFPACI